MFYSLTKIMEAIMISASEEFYNVANFLIMLQMIWFGFILTQSFSSKQYLKIRIVLEIIIILISVHMLRIIIIIAENMIEFKLIFGTFIVLNVISIFCELKKRFMN